MTTKKVICTADFESDPFILGQVPKIFGAGFYDGEQYHEFFGDDDPASDTASAVEQFIGFLERIDPADKDNMIVYMHNGGGFDFNYLLEYMGEDITVINGSIAKMTIRGVEFRDSLLILPVSLAKYKKVDFDYDKMLPENRYQPGIFEEIKEYLKLDCMYLHEWVSDFIDRFGLKLTLASASIGQLKDTGYKVKRGSPYYDERFREYYYGGRTQVFDGGQHSSDFVYMDINSAYPFAMLDYHPYGTEHVEWEHLPTGMYFATIRAISHGALPYRDPETGFLTFPNDNLEREYKVTSWEIEAGLDTGTLEITEVIRAYQHFETRAFTEFVNKFYQLKLEAKLRGDTTSELFYKLILNSCYGKFAIDCSRFKKYVLTEQGALPPELNRMYDLYGVEDIGELAERILYDMDIEEKEIDKRLPICDYEVVNDMMGRTIWQRPQPTNQYLNVATAASITGYVRAYLWRTICECKGVVYCDTDSIMCREFNGPESNELGDWSLECEFDDLYLAGKKLYAGHIKGADYLTEQQFNKIRKMAKSSYEADKAQAAHVGACWKKASKGSQLNPYEIRRIVREGDVINWQNKAPSFSLRFGPRFVDRNIRQTV